MATAELSTIENLVRALLRSAIEPDRESRPGAQQAEEIIFDVEVDGARYLLVRLPKATQVPVPLTPREREIVRLVALGHSNKVIANVLSISSWTVCTHLRRVFAKLGVGSRAAMVAHVAEIGRTHVGDRSGQRGDALETVLACHSDGSTNPGTRRAEPSLRLAMPSIFPQRED